MAAGEIELIRRYFAELTPARADVVLGIGDDAALLEVPAGFELAVSTDALVAGVHFAMDADPYDVGFKALAVNLSDMAAMGAEPRWATLVLTLPAADEVWLAGFTAGFRDLASEFRVALVGGDLCSGPLNVTVQIMGVVPAGSALRRDGARPGETIYVTGELGAAALALRLLAEGGRPVPPECLQRLHRPMPRVAAGWQLRGVASAAIDISDGLFLDLQRVALASGVGAEIRLDSVPLCRALSAITDPGERYRLALGTGDDYELCFTLPPGRDSLLEEIAGNCGHAISRIGAITAGNRVRWLLAEGSEFDPGDAGYQHFQGSSA
jgi:thiamine-monophosphate kinase